MSSSSRVPGRIGDFVATPSSYADAPNGAMQALKTQGPVHDRSTTAARHLWAAVVPLFLAISAESWLVRPDLPGHAIYNPFWWLGLLISAVSSIALVSGLRMRLETRAFLASTFLIVGLLTAGGAAIFPVMLHSALSPANSLTAYAVASSPSTLRVAFIWWPVAFALATTYFVSSRDIMPARSASSGTIKAFTNACAAIATHPDEKRASVQYQQCRLTSKWTSGGTPRLWLEILA